MVIESAAGPVAIRSGQQTTVTASSSWLIGRPTVRARLVAKESDSGSNQFQDQNREHFEVSTECGTLFPCRTSLRMEVAEERLFARSAGALSLENFDGLAVLEATDHQPIVIGRTSGSLEVNGGEGGVVGYNLSATTVDVHSAAGPVDLSFSEPPTRLKLVAGDQPVSVALPAGAYVVIINGEWPNTANQSLITMDDGIVHHKTAPNRIEIDSNGPLALKSTPMTDK